MIAALSGRRGDAIADVLDQVGLGGRGDDRFGTYSLGMKQRLGIAAALLGEPAAADARRADQRARPGRASREIARPHPSAGPPRTGRCSSRRTSSASSSRCATGCSSSTTGISSTPARRPASRHGQRRDRARLRAAATTSSASPTSSPPHGLEAGREDDVLVVSPDGRDPDELAEALNQQAASAGHRASPSSMSVVPPSRPATSELLEGVSR